MASTDPETIRTYDEIAPIYLNNWRDRSFLESDLREFATLLPGDGPVLDAGCGPGFDAAALRSIGLNAFGLDRSWGMLRTGLEALGGPLVQGDMCRLPLAAGSLAGIWANASLLHLPRALLPQALAEFHRTLASGGVLYVSVKLGQGAEESEYSYGRRARRHFTYWQPDELDAALSVTGFSTVFRSLNQLPAVTWLIRMAHKKDH